MISDKTLSDPWICSQAEIDQAQLLMKTGIEALSYERWFPDYTGGVTVTGRMTEQISVTGKGAFIQSWCNQVTVMIAQKLGFIYKQLKPVFYAWAKDIKAFVVTRADAIYYQSIDCAKNGLVEEVTQREAQYLSWKGIFCYAVAGIDPSGGLKDGHIAAFCPTEQDRPARVFNGGGINCIDSIDSKRTFGVKGLLPIRYFYLPF